MPEDVANVDVLKIRVTPKMIEAGVVAYDAFDERYGIPQQMVYEIFAAMLNASQKAVVLRS